MVKTDQFLREIFCGINKIGFFGLKNYFDTVCAEKDFIKRPPPLNDAEISGP